MTRQESQIEDVAKALAEMIDYDISDKTVMEHCRLAVKTLLVGLDLSQSVAMTGPAERSAVAIEYHRPTLY